LIFLRQQGMGFCVGLHHRQPIRLAISANTSPNFNGRAAAAAERDSGAGDEAAEQTGREDGDGGRHTDNAYPHGGPIGRLIRDDDIDLPVLAGGRRCRRIYAPCRV